MLPAFLLLSGISPATIFSGTEKVRSTTRFVSMIERHFQGDGSGNDPALLVILKKQQAEERADFIGGAGDPLRFRREGKLGLTEALGSRDRC